MAKSPTPKRKLCKSAGRKRYSMYQYKARTRLEKSVNLVPCSNCKELKQSHHMCPACGFYRGRMVKDVNAGLDKKITKMSA